MTAARRTEGAGGLAVTGRVARFLLDVDPSNGPGPRSLFVKLPNEGWRGDPRAFERLLRDFRTALEWQFLREITLLAGFTPEGERDRRALHLEWQRWAFAVELLQS